MCDLGWQNIFGVYFQVSSIEWSRVSWRRIPPEFTVDQRQWYHGSRTGFNLLCRWGSVWPGWCFQPPSAFASAFPVEIDPERWNYFWCISAYWARTEKQWKEHLGDWEEQEGVHWEDGEMASGTRHHRTDGQPRERVPRSCGCQIGVHLWCEWTGVGDCRNSGNRHCGLEEEHGVQIRCVICRPWLPLLMMFVAVVDQSTRETSLNARSPGMAQYGATGHRTQCCKHSSWHQHL